MRLTLKKVTGWQTRLERAERTIANVQAEVKAHRLQAKGGDLSGLTTLGVAVKEAHVHAMVATTQAKQLAEREQRKAAR